MTHPKSAGFGAPFSALLLTAILMTPIAMPLRAAESQDRPSGFRLGEPRMFIGSHLGMSLPRAGSDLFGMVTRELTLEKNDFGAPIGGVDIGFYFRSRFAAVFSLEYAIASHVSESRNFVEENGDSINQTTRFSRIPITGTLRFYPRKLGESVGSYAWLPTRMLPYIGGGAGIVRYDFSQSGRFVDSETLNIFFAKLQSDGTAITTHVLTGMDIAVTPMIVANVEARYSWAKADLSRDFVGFRPIDLAGLSVIGGIHFRF